MSDGEEDTQGDKFMQALHLGEKFTGKLSEVLDTIDPWHDIIDNLATKRDGKLTISFDFQKDEVKLIPNMTIGF